ncbi:MAG TPA: NYN domain-containing protein, partial [Alphaproteobacteria bacterium]|nr:NYN domain-containing protein [Alphaproteobacteria bacterium]
MAQRFAPEVGEEKGIDVRLCLDLIRLVRNKQLDVGVIFSQDQDLSEVVADVRDIAKEQNRWVKLACAFPTSATETAHRGINGTDWLKMDQDFYDACLDPYD